jgi:hypothetical protein
VVVKTRETNWRRLCVIVVSREFSRGIREKVLKVKKATIFIKMPKKLENVKQAGRNPNVP